MPSVMADSSTVESVCESIDATCNEIQSLTGGLKKICADAVRADDLDAIVSLLWELTQKLQKCSAIFEVHHDLLDNAGKTSKLFQLTDSQDLIEEMLDVIEFHLILAGCGVPA